MMLKKALVVYMNHTKLTLRIVCSVLSKKGIKYSLVTRRKLHPNHIKNKDIIVTVGGDGTFLRAAHYVKETPVLAVSPDINKHDGFFARADKKNFENVIDRIITDRNKFILLTRLYAKIDNKNIEYSLNEIYVGSRKAYIMSKYTLKIGGNSEFQKSSGLLIGTAAGSNAWIKAAHGKKLPLTSDRYQLVVREPFPGKFLKYSLLNKVLTKKNHIKIVSHMKHGIVVADSVSRPYVFKSNSVLEVGISKYPMRLVSI